MLYLLLALLILGLVVGLSSLVGHRRYKQREAAGTLRPGETSPLDTVDVPTECCGQHAVCERDSLLAAVSADIIYYDDEELDVYRGRAADSYDDAEIEEFAAVFYELREVEVAGWVRSLELRGIELPEALRDEVLLVVRERRFSPVESGVDRSTQKVGAMAVVALCIAVLLSGCKANNAVTRQYKGLTTRFNTYFNGKMAYEDGLRSMERKPDDDFTRRVMLHPVYQYAGGNPQTGGSFKRAIDKCKKCVQNKSMPDAPKHRRSSASPEYKKWLTRSEYNPYIHNAWLLSGRAQFYQGDFDAADATFAYTARRFWWLPMVGAECHIWRARCYVLRDDRYSAEAELALVVPQGHYASQAELDRQEEYQKLSRRLQREFSLAVAEIALMQDGHEYEALDYLPRAKGAFLSREQKTRATFLMAQLGEQLGDTLGAYRGYRMAARHARDYNMQFNARMAETRVMPAASIDAVERRLNRMRRMARNAEYLDQIHYALGNVAMMRPDTALAIAQYEQAVEKSTRGGIDKAVAALRLGELTFGMGDYVKAQKAYATAVSILPNTYQGYADIKRLSDVLDELQVHAETIQLQDSLLRLAALPEEELNRAIDRIIENLIAEERRAEEEGRLEEYESKRGQMADPLAQSTSQPVVGEQDRSWYFYNPAVVRAGKVEFQRRWGTRRAEDDWRRRDKSQTLLAGASVEATDTTAGVAMADGSMPVDSLGSQADSTLFVDDELATDPHSREYYMAQIPFTAEQKQIAHGLIEDGLYNEGVILNEKLENFPLAISTFLDMMRRYPTSEYGLEAYYAIYLMCLRMGQDDMAAAYRDSLVSAFPESAYAAAVSDPDYVDNLRQMTVWQDSLYVGAYAAYLRSASDSVHAAYDYVHTMWPLSPLMPKFLFLHALAYVQQGDVASFGEALEQLTATYPNSDVSPLATMMVKGVHEGRTVQQGATAQGMMWGASLRQGDGGEAVDSSIVFVDDPTQPFLLLLAYKTDSIAQNDLLFEIAKFNFENFLVKDFDLEIIDTGGGLSVLVVSGFANADELFDYHDKMDASPSLSLPEGITLVDISDPNFRALLAGRTFEEYFEWVEATFGEE